LHSINPVENFIDNDGLITRFVNIVKCKFVGGHGAIVIRDSRWGVQSLTETGFPFVRSVARNFLGRGSGPNLTKYGEAYGSLDRIRAAVSRLQHHGPEPPSLLARTNSCYET